MALIKAKKIQILALKKHENQILDFLQDSEAFAVCKADEDLDLDKNNNVSFKNVEKNKWEIEFAINFLKPYFPEKKAFKYAFIWDKEILSIDHVKKIADQYNFNADTEKCIGYEKDLNLLKSDNTEIQKEIDILSKFKKINFDLSIVSHSTNVAIFLWEIKSISFSLLKEDLEKFSDFLEIFVIQTTKTNVSFAVVYLNKINDWVLNILNNFVTTEFKDFKNYKNIAEFFLNANNKIIENNRIEKELIEKIKILKPSLPKLKASYDYFSWLCDQKEVSSSSLSTTNTIIVNGWISWNKTDQIIWSLSSITDWNIEISQIEPETWEKVPVEIVNKPLFKPFEAVTSLYWLPKANEFDPTPYVSIFFWIFFAFCLTDAVYGLLIFIGAYLALNYMIVPKDTRPLLALLVYVWISTTIMWVLFWWYAWLQEYWLIPQSLMSLQKFDMVKWMELVMWLAFWLWFIHILAWTLLKWAHSFKQWNIWSAIFMNFSWLAFFWIIAAESYYGVIWDYLWITIWIMAACLSYDTKWFMKLIVWPFNILNEAIAWWSNILSYARLFALWISTWIIAIVFNQIAVTIGWMLPPWLSILVIVIIILIGHTLNIAMNSLWAFIHSSRLQFVEFYWKFLEWWWSHLNPMKRKSTFVYID